MIRKFLSILDGMKLLTDSLSNLQSPHEVIFLFEVMLKLVSTINPKNNETNDNFYRKVEFLMYTNLLGIHKEVKKRMNNVLGIRKNLLGIRKWRPQS